MIVPTTNLAPRFLSAGGSHRTGSLEIQTRRDWVVDAIVNALQDERNHSFGDRRAVRCYAPAKSPTFATLWNHTPDCSADAVQNLLRQHSDHSFTVRKSRRTSDYVEGQERQLLVLAVNPPGSSFPICFRFFFDKDRDRFKLWFPAETGSIYSHIEELETLEDLLRRCKAYRFVSPVPSKPVEQHHETNTLLEQIGKRAEQLGTLPNTAICQYKVQ